MSTPLPPPLSSTGQPIDPAAGASAEIDVLEARRLLDALERDLGGISAGAANVDLLRAELSELRRVLHADETSPEVMQSGLHDMRDRLHEFQDGLKSDAFQAGRYLAELGRILGL